MMLLLVLGYQLSLRDLTPTPARIYANNTQVVQSTADVLQGSVYTQDTVCIARLLHCTL